MATPAKLNLRLPPDLKAQAEEVAAFHGLSLNALCVMALRSYVPYMAKKAAQPAPLPTAVLRGVPQATTGTPAPPMLYRGAALNAPCPCGSGKKYKRCHGHAAR